MATTTTTKCDKCKNECVYGCVRFVASTEHWTGQREYAGSDQYKPIELCMTCGQIAIEMLGMQPEMIQPRDSDDDIDSPSPVMYQPVLPRPMVAMHGGGVGSLIASRPADVRALREIGAISENQESR